MHRFRLAPIAWAMGALCMQGAAWGQATSNVGRVDVQGAPGGTDSGLITQEETPKARSSVNKTYLENRLPSTNVFQAIELLPGVNSFSQDATGLFGGGARVRGFAQDQMGLTINGAPVNDSGNFAVFPQEYTDIENLCEIFITQGSTDTDAPHVGASGGNIGIVSCGPKPEFGLRAAQSFGDLHYQRTFVRIDSGNLGVGGLKAFLSYSHTEANKFKGPGEANRQHVDFGVEARPASTVLLSSTVLYNYAVNNNIRFLSKQQIAQFGPTLDFSAVPPQHLTPVTGTAQSEVTPVDGFYKFNINPFQNLLWTAKAEWAITPKLQASFDPYYWWGFGTGGSQLTTVREGNAGTILGGGVRDINSDTDALDTVQVYRSNVTDTNRPGATAKLKWQLANQTLVGGVWYERARHRQTAPAQRFDNSGNTADQWLATPSAWLLRQSGGYYENRDWLTISTGKSVFASDSINLMRDRLNVTVGVRRSGIERDFTNFANESSTATTGRSDGDYNIVTSYWRTLPSFGARYALTSEQHVFANATKNFRVPSNFVLSNLLTGGTVVNGVLTGATLKQPKIDVEESWNYDVGYRRANDRWTFSSTLFYVDFMNRIAQPFDPVTNTRFDLNVGDAFMHGLELEAGYRISGPVSVYASYTYTISKMKQNLQNAALPAAPEPTAGKTFPDTPKILAGLALRYNTAGLFGSLEAKYTGRAYTTLVNDEDMDPYWLVNASAGYKFPSSAFFKNPMLRFNVVNLFDKSYLRINSPSGSSFTVRAQGPGGSAPTYIVGAPRFVGFTLQSDF